MLAQGKVAVLLAFEPNKRLAIATTLLTETQRHAASAERANGAKLRPRSFTDGAFKCHEMLVGVLGVVRLINLLCYIEAFEEFCNVGVGGLPRQTSSSNDGFFVDLIIFRAATKTEKSALNLTPLLKAVQLDGMESV